MAIKSFEGKTAFITGGASGIGLGIAKAFSARGARIVIADLRPDHIEKALATFAGGAQSNSVSAIEIDVTNREAYADAAEKMQAEFGGIDILVNNAGVGVEGPILEARYADWDFGLGVNVNGVVNGLQAFLPQMIAHGRGGHIVNTSSLAAAVMMPEQFVIYAAGKAAVLNMSENMREVLAAKNIGMSVLLPAFTKSNIHEAARNRPAHLRKDSGFKASEKALSEREIGAEWMEPEEVGEMVAKGVLNNDLYIITHGQFKNRMRERAEAMLAATPESDFQF
ncbi:SDR family NAD(P)-dependent oxidoreductase [Hyphococcus sp.]|jgi:NAD(P)-dependent dehydrogenase (short-subunit alcohol dehydrogenase family)|uniref:SDR family NAD(P)-dependent oxidoreductase n=1 Tax=Hyphococcus sp. TaxID=2038636 RepID=UPI003D0CBB0A